MTGIAYAIIACGFVVAAVVVNLIMRFDAEGWLRRDLRRGDLYALIDVASGLRPDPHQWAGAPSQGARYGVLLR